MATLALPEENVVSIKDLERKLDKAQRRAGAPFLADQERARRQDDVDAIQRELDIGLAAAEEQLAGHGRRRSRW